MNKHHVEVATRWLDPAHSRPSDGTDPLAIDGFDHVEIYTESAKQSAYFLSHAFGFVPVAYRGPETGHRDSVSIALRQGDVFVQLTSSLRSNTSIASFVYTHGFSTRDIAFKVGNCEAAYYEAMRRGAISVSPPTELRDSNGSVIHAAIRTYGDTIHSFVERTAYKGPYYPGFADYSRVFPRGVQIAEAGLQNIDHVVGNVELGKMEEWVSFYERILGFSQLKHFSDKDISTEYSALMSKVMNGGQGKIKLPINEPAQGKRKSQIEEYLDFHNGPGVQHIAFATRDIISTVSTLRERGDYASATSSRSSKMAHGGLRYLEMFDFQQVFEGIKSREELFERCPNLVTPHPFLIPVPRDGYVLRYKLALGLFLYDLLVKNPARRHAWIPKAELSFSGFNSTRDDLMGCFRYTDGLMNDSRLVIEMIVSAERHDAQCLNYARVEHIRKEQDGLMTVVWRDLLTDQEHISRAKIVVNCAGPWAPQLREANDIHQALEVRYSRGTHLLFSTPWRDPALFLPLPEKGRYYFVWPHPTGTMVGTTEREVDELALDPQPSADEVEEVLGRLKKDLPHSGLSRETLHYAFAGIRTLPMRSARKGVSRLSRKHVWRFSQGVLTLLGGKYTTFAWTAAEGLSRVLHELGRGKQTVDALDDLPSVTDSRSSEQLLNQLRDQYGYEGPGVERAVKRLGRLVLRYTEQSHAWTELTGGVLRLELLNALELEHAETVEDVLRRRLDLEYTPSHGLECLGVVADALAERRGREVVEREQREIVERLRVLHRLLGIPEIKACSSLGRI